MKRLSLLLAALLASAVLPFPASSQAPAPPDLPEAPAAPAAPGGDVRMDDANEPNPDLPRPKSRSKRKPARAPKPPRARDLVATLDEVVVRPGQTVGDVTVTLGSARIEGDVEGDVVVVGGKATVLGRVSGDVVNVGGGARIEDGARVGGDVVAVGYGAVRGSDGVVAGEVWNVGLTALPERYRDRALSYYDACFSMARPLAPGLGWLWVFWAGMLALHALLAILFPGAVGRLLRTMESRPVGTALLGVLGLPLVLLATALIGATMILTLALPFLAAALAMGLLFARAAIYQYLGRRVLAVFTKEEPHGLLAFAVGAALATALFLVPVLGALVWLLFGLWALGAVLLAVFGREPKPAAVAARAATAAPAGMATRLAVDIEPAGAGTMPAAAAAGAGIAGIAGIAATTLAADAPPSGAGGGAGAGGPPPAGGAGPDPESETASRRVGFWRRAGALWIDWIPVVFVAEFLQNHAWAARHHSTKVEIVLAVAYYTLMVAWRGTTLGGLLLGMRVVRLDGRPMTRQVALVRACSAVLSGLAMFIGWFWAFWDPRGQTWHDKLAGTVVVRDEEPRSLV